MSLGAKLVGERQARGLSQRALAAELGVGLRSVLRWENGENEPSGLYARVVEDWIEAGVMARKIASQMKPLTVRAVAAQHRRVNREAGKGACRCAVCDEAAGTKRARRKSVERADSRR